MVKNIYSLVLSEEIIKEVDKLAYDLGTSRSNVINKILAEHFSISTPEKRMSDIFSEVERYIDEEKDLQVQPRVSESMMLLRSILQYKYKPTMKYSIELYKEETDKCLGEIKVFFRTQNQTLIEAATTFFIIWSELEMKYISKFFPGEKINYKIKEGKFIRQFIIPSGNHKEEEIGFAISNYIKILDYILKIYFQNISNVEKAVKEMEEKYIKCMKDVKVII